MGASKGFGFIDFNSKEDAKTVKEPMEDGGIDGNKITLDWAEPKGESGFGVMVEAEEVLEAKREAEETEVDLVAETKEALEGKVASEEAEEEEETISHKERS
ncbi:Nucleolin [Tupaia chinensis]|uniref:Nucleolin n=1 Tax=Tupaia chinensis TaxID=246437 RepID=L9KK10_TUPCH|nr:Nucleolin [Tupaia chinensis]